MGGGDQVWRDTRLKRNKNAVINVGLGAVAMLSFACVVTNQGLCVLLFFGMGERSDVARDALTLYYTRLVTPGTGATKTFTVTI